MNATSRADLIFVLAGREIRKHYALELYRENYSGRLLLSVARYEVRRFSSLPWPKKINFRDIAASVHPPERHFFVCFAGDSVTVDQIVVGRWGTLSEIRALAAWLETHRNVRRVLIVSSHSHLSRIRLCCQHLLKPSIEWELVPVPPNFAPSTSEGRTDTGRIFAFDLKELPKLLCYRLAFLLVPKKMAGRAI